MGLLPSPITSDKGGVQPQIRMHGFFEQKGAKGEFSFVAFVCCRTQLFSEGGRDGKSLICEISRFGIGMVQFIAGVCQPRSSFLTTMG